VSTREDLPHPHMPGTSKSKSWRSTSKSKSWRSTPWRWCWPASYRALTSTVQSATPIMSLIRMGFFDGDPSLQCWFCDPNGHANGTGFSPTPAVPHTLIVGANQLMVVGPITLRVYKRRRGVRGTFDEVRCNLISLLHLSLDRSLRRSSCTKCHTVVLHVATALDILALIGSGAATTMPRQDRRGSATTSSASTSTPAPTMPSPTNKISGETH
jgi:hypothetical protein